MLAEYANRERVVKDTTHSPKLNLISGSAT